jgi:endonuclease-3 related protein
MRITPNLLFNKLMKKYGHQKWWPIDNYYHKKNGSDPRFEIIVGAILTQNTSWSNVEKTLENIKMKNLLDIKNIAKIDIITLKNLIKSSGFFNQKAKRIKNFALYLYKNFNNDLDLFFNRDLNDIRRDLLSLDGIGLETADSILLYAGNKPIFVVDAYTKRLCKRLSFNINISYNEIQQFFKEYICKKYSKSQITQIYNELHALIVIHAKNLCKIKPNCCDCPLKNYCRVGKNISK